jgi:uncharacterized protein involved in exopolysaccharide biosynthesis
VNEEIETGRPGLPVDLGRIWYGIRSQWKLLPKLLVLGAVVGVGAAYFLMHPVYTAKAVLVWDRANADPMDRSFVTQIESARLPANLKAVQKRLHIGGSVDDLQRKLDVISDTQSRLVTVEASDNTPNSAATLAKTVVDVWLEQQRDLGHDRQSDRLTELQSDQKAAEKDLYAARQKFDKFQVEVGVADYFGELKLAITKVNTLQQDISGAGADADAESARARELALQNAGLRDTTVATATIIDPTAMKLAELQSQLSSDSSHLSDDHPTIIRLKAQIQRLRSQRNTTVQSAASIALNPLKQSVQTSLVQSKLAREAALQRAATASQNLETARDWLAKLVAVQGTAQQLSAELETQEKHAQEIKTMIIQASDQVRTTPSDFRVVTQATVPEHANPSKRRLVAIAFPVAFMLFGLLGIVARDLKGLKIHTAREAAFWLNAPVVGSTTWPREAHWHNLANELADAAPRGTTLVIPARAQDLHTANMISSWMDIAQIYVAPTIQVQGTALARLPQPGHETGSVLTVAQTWTGPTKGQELRRASRLADRVLVVCPSGVMSVSEILSFKNKLGRTEGVGILLVGLRPEHAELPDRVGEVEQFWSYRQLYMS